MDEVEYEERGIKMYRAFIVFPAAEYGEPHPLSHGKPRFLSEADKMRSES